MSEQAYIECETRKQDAKLLSRLKKVNRCGDVGPAWAKEALIIAGWIQFGPPTMRIRFNHYRLTDAGWEKLVELRNKLGA